MKLKQYTWADFDKAVRQMAFKCKAHPDAMGIYGVPRGGLCLAVALSHALGLPLVQRPGPGIIWVDDIADRGDTLAVAEGDGCIFRVVWFKKRHCPKEVACANEIPNHHWVVFPWESFTNARADYNEYIRKRS